MPRSHHSTLIPAIGSICLLALTTFIPLRSSAQSAQMIAAPAPAAATAGAAPVMFTNLMNSHFALNSGITLLNPYSATTNGLSGDPTGRRRLENGDGSDSKFFIEVVYNYVWAWDPVRRARFARELHARKKGPDGGVWFWKWDEGASLDLQARLSFYAKDDKETTASAIVGSGSFGSELTVGLPIYRAIYTHSGRLESSPPATATKADLAKYAKDTYDNTDTVHWVGIVGSYSGVTDSDAFDIHTRALLGLSYRAATTRLSFIDGREAVLSITAGVAAVDSVEFENDDTREIKIHHEDVPDYRMRAAFGLEMEMYFPITSSLSAVMGTRLYNGLDPNIWNAYVALTVPLDKLASLIK